MARSKKEILEMREDDDDFLLDSMDQITQNSIKMNEKLKTIFDENERNLTKVIK